MSKHTPGPWQTSIDGERVLDNTESFVANCKPTDSAFPMNKANARLIAAAPELLAALKVLTLDAAVKSWLEAHDPKAIEQARAAIARAEGREQ